MEFVLGSLWLTERFTSVPPPPSSFLSPSSPEKECFSHTGGIFSLEEEGEESATSPHRTSTSASMPGAIRGRWMHRNGDRVPYPLPPLKGGRGGGADGVVETHGSHSAVLPPPHPASMEWELLDEDVKLTMRDVDTIDDGGAGGGEEGRPSFRDRRSRRSPIPPQYVVLEAAEDPEREDDADSPTEWASGSGGCRWYRKPFHRHAVPLGFLSSESTGPCLPPPTTTTTRKAGSAVNGSSLRIPAPPPPPAVFSSSSPSSVPPLVPTSVLNGKYVLLFLPPPREMDAGTSSADTHGSGGGGVVSTSLPSAVSTAHNSMTPSPHPIPARSAGGGGGPAFTTTPPNNTFSMHGGGGIGSSGGTGLASVAEGGEAEENEEEETVSFHSSFLLAPLSKQARCRGSRGTGPESGGGGSPRSALPLPRRTNATSVELDRGWGPFGYRPAGLRSRERERDGWHRGGGWNASLAGGVSHDQEEEEVMEQDDEDDDDDDDEERKGRKRPGGRRSSQRWEDGCTMIPLSSTSAVPLREIRSWFPFSSPSDCRSTLDHLAATVFLQRAGESFLCYPISLSVAERTRQKLLVFYNLLLSQRRGEAAGVRSMFHQQLQQLQQEVEKDRKDMRRPPQEETFAEEHIKEEEQEEEERRTSEWWSKDKGLREEEAQREREHPTCVSAPPLKEDRPPTLFTNTRRNKAPPRRRNLSHGGRAGGAPRRSSRSVSFSEQGTNTGMPLVSHEAENEKVVVREKKRHGSTKDPASSALSHLPSTSLFTSTPQHVSPPLQRRPRGNTSPSREKTLEESEEEEDETEKKKAVQKEEEWKEKSSRIQAILEEYVEHTHIPIAVLEIHYPPFAQEGFSPVPSISIRDKTSTQMTNTTNNPTTSGLSIGSGTEVVVGGGGGGGGIGGSKGVLLPPPPPTTTTTTTETNTLAMKSGGETEGGGGRLAVPSVGIRKNDGGPPELCTNLLPFPPPSSSMTTTTITNGSGEYAHGSLALNEKAKGTVGEESGARGYRGPSPLSSPLLPVSSSMFGPSSSSSISPTSPTSFSASLTHGFKTEKRSKKEESHRMWCQRSQVKEKVEEEEEVMRRRRMMGVEDDHDPDAAEICQMIERSEVLKVLRVLTGYDDVAEPMQEEKEEREPPRRRHRDAEEEEEGGIRSQPSPTRTRRRMAAAAAGAEKRRKTRKRTRLPWMDFDTAVRLLYIKVKQCLQIQSMTYLHALCFTTAAPPPLGRRHPMALLLGGLDASVFLAAMLEEKIRSPTSSPVLPTPISRTGVVGDRAGPSSSPPCSHLARLSTLSTISSVSSSGSSTASVGPSLRAVSSPPPPLPAGSGGGSNTNNGFRSSSHAVAPSFRTRRQDHPSWISWYPAALGMLFHEVCRWMEKVEEVQKMEGSVRLLTQFALEKKKEHLESERHTQTGLLRRGPLFASTPSSSLVSVSHHHLPALSHPAWGTLGSPRSRSSAASSQRSTTTSVRSTSPRQEEVVLVSTSNNASTMVPPMSPPPPPAGKGLRRVVPLSKAAMMVDTLASSLRGNATTLLSVRIGGGAKPSEVGGNGASSIASLAAMSSSPSSFSSPSTSPLGGGKGYYAGLSPGAGMAPSEGGGAMKGSLLCPPPMHPPLLSEATAPTGVFSSSTTHETPPAVGLESLAIPPPPVMVEGGGGELPAPLRTSTAISEGGSSEVEAVFTPTSLPIKTRQEDAEPLRSYALSPFRWMPPTNLREGSTLLFGGGGGAAASAVLSAKATTSTEVLELEEKQRKATRLVDGILTAATMLCLQVGVGLVEGEQDLEGSAAARGVHDHARRPLFPKEKKSHSHLFSVDHSVLVQPLPSSSSSPSPPLHNEVEHTSAGGEEVNPSSSEEKKFLRTSVSITHHAFPSFPPPSSSYRITTTSFTRRETSGCGGVLHLPSYRSHTPPHPVRSHQKETLVLSFSGASSTSPCLSRVGPEEEEDTASRTLMERTYQKEGGEDRPQAPRTPFSLASGLAEEVVSNNPFYGGWYELHSAEAYQRVMQYCHIQEWPAVVLIGPNGEVITTDALSHLEKELQTAVCITQDDVALPCCKKKDPTITTEERGGFGDGRASSFSFPSLPSCRSPEDGEEKTSPPQEAEEPVLQVRERPLPTSRPAAHRRRRRRCSSGRPMGSTTTTTTTPGSPGRNRHEGVDDGGKKEHSCLSPLPLAPRHTTEEEEDEKEVVSSNDFSEVFRSRSFIPSGLPFTSPYPVSLCSARTPSIPTHPTSPVQEGRLSLCDVLGTKDPEQPPQRRGGSGHRKSRSRSSSGPRQSHSPRRRLPPLPPRGPSSTVYSIPPEDDPTPSPSLSHRHPALVAHPSTSGPLWFAASSNTSFSYSAKARTSPPGARWMQKVRSTGKQKGVMTPRWDLSSFLHSQYAFLFTLFYAFFFTLRLRLVNSVPTAAASPVLKMERRSSETFFPSAATAPLHPTPILSRKEEPKSIVPVDSRPSTTTRWLMSLPMTEDFSRGLTHPPSSVSRSSIRSSPLPSCGVWPPQWPRPTVGPHLTPVFSSAVLKTIPSPPPLPTTMLAPPRMDPLQGEAGGEHCDERPTSSRRSSPIRPPPPPPSSLGFSGPLPSVLSCSIRREDSQGSCPGSESGREGSRPPHHPGSSCLNSIESRGEEREPYVLSRHSSSSSSGRSLPPHTSEVEHEGAAPRNTLESNSTIPSWKKREAPQRSNRVVPIPPPSWGAEEEEKEDEEEEEEEEEEQEEYTTWCLTLSSQFPWRRPSILSSPSSFWWSRVEAVKREGMSGVRVDPISPPAVPSSSSVVATAFSSTAPTGEGDTHRPHVTTTTPAEEGVAPKEHEEVVVPITYFGTVYTVDQDGAVIHRRPPPPPRQEEKGGGGGMASGREKEPHTACWRPISSILDTSTTSSSSSDALLFDLLAYQSVTVRAARRALRKEALTPSSSFSYSFLLPAPSFSSSSSSSSSSSLPSSHDVEETIHGETPYETVLDIDIRMMPGKMLDDYHEEEGEVSTAKRDNWWSRFSSSSSSSSSHFPHSSPLLTGRSHSDGCRKGRSRESIVSSQHSWPSRHQSSSSAAIPLGLSTSKRSPATEEGGDLLPLPNAEAKREGGSLENDEDGKEIREERPSSISSRFVVSFAGTEAERWMEASHEDPSEKDEEEKEESKDAPDDAHEKSEGRAKKTTASLSMVALPPALPPPHSMVLPPPLDPFYDIIRLSQEHFTEPRRADGRSSSFPPLLEGAFSPSAETLAVCYPPGPTHFAVLVGAGWHPGMEKMTADVKRLVRCLGYRDQQERRKARRKKEPRSHPITPPPLHDDLAMRPPTCTRSKIGGTEHDKKKVKEKHLISSFSSKGLASTLRRVAWHHVFHVTEGRGELSGKFRRYLQQHGPSIPLKRRFFLLLSAFSFLPVVRSWTRAVRGARRKRVPLHHRHHHDLCGDVLGHDEEERQRATCRTRRNGHHRLFFLRGPRQWVRCSHRKITTRRRPRAVTTREKAEAAAMRPMKAVEKVVEAAHLDDARHSTPMLSARATSEAMDLWDRSSGSSFNFFNQWSMEHPEAPPTSRPTWLLTNAVRHGKAKWCALTEEGEVSDSFFDPGHSEGCGTSTSSSMLSRLLLASSSFSTFSEDSFSCFHSSSSSTDLARSVGEVSSNTPSPLLEVARIVRPSSSSSFSSSFPTAMPAKKKERMALPKERKEKEFNQKKEDDWTDVDDTSSFSSSLVAAMPFLSFPRRTGEEEGREERERGNVNVRMHPGRRRSACFSDQGMKKDDEEAAAVMELNGGFGGVEDANFPLSVMDGLLKEGKGKRKRTHQKRAIMEMEPTCRRTSSTSSRIEAKGTKIPLFRIKEENDDEESDEDERERKRWRRWCTSATRVQVVYISLDESAQDLEKTISRMPSSWRCISPFLSPPPPPSATSSTSSSSYLARAFTQPQPLIQSAITYLQQRYDLQELPRLMLWWWNGKSKTVADTRHLRAIPHALSLPFWYPWERSAETTAAVAGFSLGQPGMKTEPERGLEDTKEDTTHRPDTQGIESTRRTGKEEEEETCTPPMPIPGTERIHSESRREHDTPAPFIFIQPHAEVELRKDYKGKRFPWWGGGVTQAPVWPVVDAIPSLSPSPSPPSPPPLLILVPPMPHPSAVDSSSGVPREAHHERERAPTTRRRTSLEKEDHKDESKTEASKHVEGPRSSSAAAAAAASRLPHLGEPWISPPPPPPLRTHGSPLPGNTNPMTSSPDGLPLTSPFSSVHSIPSSQAIALWSDHQTNIFTPFQGCAWFHPQNLIHTRTSVPCAVNPFPTTSVEISQGLEHVSTIVSQGGGAAGDPHPAAPPPCTMSHTSTTVASPGELGVADAMHHGDATHVDTTTTATPILHGAMSWGMVRPLQSFCLRSTRRLVHRQCCEGTSSCFLFSSSSSSSPCCCGGAKVETEEQPPTPTPVALPCLGEPSGHLKWTSSPPGAAVPLTIPRRRTKEYNHEKHEGTNASFTSRSHHCPVSLDTMEASLLDPLLDGSACVFLCAFGEVEYSVHAESVRVLQQAACWLEEKLRQRQSSYASTIRKEPLEKLFQQSSPPPSRWRTMTMRTVLRWRPTSTITPEEDLSVKTTQWEGPSLSTPHKADDDDEDDDYDEDEEEEEEDEMKRERKRRRFTAAARRETLRPSATVGAPLTPHPFSPPPSGVGTASSAFSSSFSSVLTAGERERSPPGMMSSPAEGSPVLSPHRGGGGLGKGECPSFSSPASLPSSPSFRIPYTDAKQQLPRVVFLDTIYSLDGHLHDVPWSAPVGMEHQVREEVEPSKRMGERPKKESKRDPTGHWASSVKDAPQRSPSPPREEPHTAVLHPKDEEDEGKKENLQEGGKESSVFTFPSDASPPLLARDTQPTTTTITTTAKPQCHLDNMVELRMAHQRERSILQELVFGPLLVVPFCGGGISGTSSFSCLTPSAPLSPTTRLPTQGSPNVEDWGSLVSHLNENDVFVVLMMDVPSRRRFHVWSPSQHHPEVPTPMLRTSPVTPIPAASHTSANTSSGGSNSSTSSQWHAMKGHTAASSSSSGAGSVASVSSASSSGVGSVLPNTTTPRPSSPLPPSVLRDTPSSPTRRMRRTKDEALPPLATTTTTITSPTSTQQSALVLEPFLSFLSVHVLGEAYP